MLFIDYKDKRPIYEQIKDGIKNMIISNVYMEDEKLPSVRELSLELTVNPNTIQRAYKDLETENYIYSVIGKGNFVSKKAPKKDAEKIEGLYKELEKCVKELAFLNEPKQNLMNLIQNIYGGIV